MKSISGILLAGVAAVAMMAASASAADDDPQIVIDEAPEHVPLEIGNGWYLRGDIGYAFTRANDPTNFRMFDGISYDDAVFDSTNPGDTHTLGVGLGYQFTEWFRADAIFETQRNDFSGTKHFAGPCTGGPANTHCRSEDEARARSYSFLANFYADLGTYVGLTPYVGAGAGVAWLQWNTLDSRQYCVDGAANCPNPAFAGTNMHEGESSWRFTYALMAGVAYDVSRKLKIDLGYRYRRIAGGPMYGFDAAGAAAGASGVQGRDKGLSQHEVKIGMRYSLW